MAIFERFPERFEHAPVEFRQLIEKQHAVMGQRNLPGSWMAAAADQGHAGGRVMRRAERALLPRLEIEILITCLLYTSPSPRDKD